MSELQLKNTSQSDPHSNSGHRVVSLCSFLGPVTSVLTEEITGEAVYNYAQTQMENMEQSNTYKFKIPSNPTDGPGELIN